MSAIRIACWAVLTVALLVAAVVDARRRIIPNPCCSAVAASAVVMWLIGADTWGSFASGVVGAGVVAALLAMTAAVSRALTGARGIGGGDIKLYCALALWGGWTGGVFVVAASCVLALAWPAAARLMGHEDVKSMPMAPAIAAAFAAGVALGLVPVV